MKPVNQGVTPLDLQAIRKQNEDSLQTRATQHLGADLKTGSNSKTSKDEKLTAGQGDQVELTANKKTSGSSKADKAEVSTSEAPAAATVPGGSATTAAPETAEAAAPGSSAETNRPEAVDSETSSEYSAEATEADDNEMPDFYSAQDTARLERLRELQDQAKEMRAMWRKMYNEWVEAQLKWMEDLENFRQSVLTMWSEIAVARSIQSTKQCEAVRSLL